MDQKRTITINATSITTILSGALLAPGRGAGEFLQCGLLSQQRFLCPQCIRLGRRYVQSGRGLIRVQLDGRDQRHHVYGRRSPKRHARHRPAYHQGVWPQQWTAKAWNSTVPTNFTLPAIPPARYAGVDVTSAAATSLVGRSTPLPGFAPGYFRGPRPIWACIRTSILHKLSISPFPTAGISP